MLSYADIDRPLGSIKLRARFELIERRPDRRRTRSAPGRLVVAAPQPGSETFAANRPSFSMAVCYEVGECDPAGSVKQFLKSIISLSIDRELTPPASALLTPASLPRVPYQPACAARASARQ
jgi:hypothetical protein